MSVWIAETLLATSLLMALVMLLRRPTTRFLGAGAAYMLWALPLARLALPPLPRDVAPATPLQSAVDHSGLTSVLTVPTVPAPALDSALSLPWIEIAAGLWVVGAAAFLLFHAITYARFRRLMLADAVPLGHEGRIRIVASPHTTGPLAFGVLHPYIALPLDFDTRFDADERAMAMAHECAHHQRGDLFANMIALAVMALHWCNPIAWIAWASYRADQELACDARVLARHGQDKAHVYGRAIVKAAGGRPFATARFSATCHLTRLDTLKGRLKMLSNHADSLHRISWGMAAVALVTLAGLALTASGSRAAREMAAITNTVDDVNMARLTNLMTDAPPSAPVQPQWADEPAAPSEPAAMTHAEDMAPAPPAAPDAPIVPAADMVAPIPPVPPAPPVTVRSQRDRITVTHANGRVETHRIPTEADIARMVPVVDVNEGCDSNGKASRQESVNADGRRVIRVRICQAAIDSASRAADRASARADWESRDADRASAQAERASRLADRESARANVAALKAMRNARAEIASDRSMPASARAQALREIDGEIASMRAGND